MSYSLILSVFFVSFMTQEKKKKLEGEEKEEEFLLVFLVIYSTAELHAQAYTFLSQRFNTPPELVQVS